eukprot:Blabericola_migrator_1__5492@NODE_27_length_20109_cov_273_259006_g24_i0_p1_GENE_NODE_27_length_20109_cov_273_259006_g24_i0NODE_27_length_20109_cov_273_259006_g24_i0_p1_ORF_typecomplete_len1384_score349_05PFK/PF00365_20/9_4e72PFK/PF00365_20/6_3e53_NODE_27_length_20109_cov_273_259006_g24_i01423318384
MQRRTSKIAAEGTDYATKRSFSVLLDDPMLEDKLQTRFHEPSKMKGIPESSYDFTHSFSDGIGGAARTPDDPHSPMARQGQVHLQSADLFDFFSPVQKERQTWLPKLADVFKREACWLRDIEIDGVEAKNADEISQLYPKIFPQSCLAVTPVISEEDAHKVLINRKPLRVGVVLSGGPAPGGHNVIAGVYDYIKKVHPESQLIGFMGGLDGFFQQDYIIVDDELMLRFRNSGGFDMFWSGRGKVTPDDKPSAKKAAVELDLKGLIIIGGDGSNSNAAILAEYFATEVPKCCVIGIPKTIDGDLKNLAIEISFGFDTAAKTYSECIGNLCTDACCGQGVYHFVRVMGRSASHLVLECAMQTRPNLVFIGEEIEAKDISLATIVDDIVQLVLERSKKGKDYGIILVPEGLIGFIPEMKLLIEELSQPGTADENGINPAALSEKSKNLWFFLPDIIRAQLSGDREATGYVQVAKIATERLLILLVEEQLAKLEGYDLEKWNRMHHYFGYEGRCAMPSNFDANYCYNLGYTAGCLIENRKTGYMAVVKGLIHDPVQWEPIGVPFTKLMEMITLPGGMRIPGITRQLTDIKGEAFKVFTQVREKWRLGDYYRCPGPIQFEGPASDISNYTVTVPLASQLLDEDEQTRRKAAGGKCVLPGRYSQLQTLRSQWTPPVPSLCLDVDASCSAGSQVVPKDPYARRQILVSYPELCASNDFTLQDVKSEGSKNLPPRLKIGVFFASRQSPGMQNIIWGLHNRLQLTGGLLYGFKGAQGLLQGEAILVTDDMLKPHKNLGGVEILGRGTEHVLLKRENRKKVLQNCLRLDLDGLVMIGSSLAMTEAAMLAEYFIQKKARTRIIGIPATASNNVLNELIETNVGFDTASKLYSSLIGNILTDAASMPKYWHFVRLMGRQPSNEVLECALQTHPNVVIIAEEYGAGQKTLADVVNDIADVVCQRADGAGNKRQTHMGKVKVKDVRNFGAVLIPDGLWHHLPTMRLLLKELNQIMSKALANDELKEARHDLLNMAGNRSQPNLQVSSNTDISPTGGSPTVSVPSGSVDYAAMLTPWSAAVWASLPSFIQGEFLTVNPELRDAFVETEVLLSQMVKAELQKRSVEGRYNGNFQAVCHYFGYQGRSAMPSNFDASLAFAHGHLAAICIESKVTGHLTTIRGLCGEVNEWKLGAVPFNCLLTVVPIEQDMQVHPDLHNTRTLDKSKDIPIVPNAEVNLNCKALRWMKVARRGWSDQDRFCNPGPIQFWGTASTFYHRLLHEEQADYFHMLRNVQKFAKILETSCDFGVEETFLKAAYVNLNSLLTLRFHSDDVLRAMTPFPKLEELEAKEKSIDKDQYFISEYNRGFTRGSDVFLPEPRGSKVTNLVSSNFVRGRTLGMN